MSPLARPSYTALNCSLALPLTPFGRYLLIYWAVKECMYRQYYAVEQKI